MYIFKKCFLTYSTAWYFEEVASCCAFCFLHKIHKLHNEQQTFNNTVRLRTDTIILFPSNSRSVFSLWPLVSDDRSACNHHHCQTLRPTVPVSTSTHPAKISCELIQEVKQHWTPKWSYAGETLSPQLGASPAYTTACCGGLVGVT